MNTFCNLSGYVYVSFYILVSTSHCKLNFSHVLSLSQSSLIIQGRCVVKGSSGGGVELAHVRCLETVYTANASLKAAPLSIRDIHDTCMLHILFLLIFLPQDLHLFATVLDSTGLSHSMYVLKPDKSGLDFKII